MTITIVGHGYVGLVSACCFADFGNEVYVIGHTPSKIERLKNGDPLIYEPGLKELLEKNIKANRLHFTLEYPEAVSKSEIVFITVGTPPKENGEADLEMVFDVGKQIAKNLKKKFTVISCKSTVPVGTNKQIEKILNENRPVGVEIAVASCPEFLREGSGLHDTFFADRVVIGSYSQKAINLLLELHEPITGKKVITDLASAELIKYASNSVLAMKISFANLISFYCEKAGGDVETVLDAVGFDKRIGRVFMDPGVGYGGSCFPKDVRALTSTGNLLGINTSLLQATEDINQEARMNFLNKIIKYSGGKTIGVWGLAFKPNTDDIRFAPSIDILHALLDKGYAVKVYDQEAFGNVKKIFGDKLIYSKDPYEAATGCDAIAILTDWNEFKHIDLDKIKSIMKKPVIIDGRNIYLPEVMKKLGFTYYSTGRVPVTQ
ncbi:UDP-glucose 6-dehydrogenase [Candidatus Roizmanbacteria bacterium CG_4_10_14_0_8_um_filter_39_9]|uniref:UDP-glucose 6-dehydrogenase n=1 Tax=Candidatus Roizmanbacteria bacterium CG_4_10_14_0_8_um_filter_39_9 TaxID=1974829 RepID=A0A2M7QD29_9BACT|nr:MAG: UDP-glucose 6-dehydrogenase [Candidatus Roizmanbacteria bacterium CG_4_10_14_0_8_um_filter_39_9]